MQLRIDRVGSHLAGMELPPECAKSHVVLPPAERTRTMTGGERGHFIEEEELREASGLEKTLSLPAAKLEPAGDPALAVVAPADSARVVVQASAVAVHEATRRVGDQLAERRDPVLKRHLACTLSP
jgi:hypothetical protein